MEELRLEPGTTIQDMSIQSRVLTNVPNTHPGWNHLKHQTGPFLPMKVIFHCAITFQALKSFVPVSSSKLFYLSSHSHTPITQLYSTTNSR